MQASPAHEDILWRGSGFGAAAVSVVVTFETRWLGTSVFFHLVSTRGFTSLYAAFCLSSWVLRKLRKREDKHITTKMFCLVYLPKSVHDIAERFSLIFCVAERLLSLLSLSLNKFCWFSHLKFARQCYRVNKNVFLFVRSKFRGICSHQVLTNIGGLFRM